VHPFRNLQSRARTHAVLVICLYDWLGNPTTQVIEPPGSSIHNNYVIFYPYSNRLQQAYCTFLASSHLVNIIHLPAITLYIFMSTPCIWKCVVNGYEENVCRRFWFVSVHIYVYTMYMKVCGQWIWGECVQTFLVCFCTYLCLHHVYESVWLFLFGTS
jgi:hypothetical protein